MFEVDTYVFNNGDHADHRWVAVVRPPSTDTDYVTVVQRSSTATDYAGLDSPRTEMQCFTKDGRWVIRYQRALRWFELESVIEHECGQLSGTATAELVAMWEAS